jgi:hypothetical protein
VFVAYRKGVRKRGYLSKKGAKVHNWKRRYCVLEEHFFRYFADDVVRHHISSPSFLSIAISILEDHVLAIVVVVVAVTGRTSQCVNLTPGLFWRARCFTACTLSHDFVTRPLSRWE